MGTTTNLVIQAKYNIGDQIKVIPYEDGKTYGAVIMGFDVEIRGNKNNLYYVVDISGRELVVIESEIVL